MHMRGKGAVWAKGLLRAFPNSTWVDICDAMCDRFGQERDKEVLMDFLKLKQYASNSNML